MTFVSKRLITYMLVTCMYPIHLCKMPIISKEPTQSFPSVNCGAKGRYAIEYIQHVTDELRLWKPFLLVSINATDGFSGSSTLWFLVLNLVTWSKHVKISENSVSVLYDHGWYHRSYECFCGLYGLLQYFKGWICLWWYVSIFEFYKDTRDEDLRPMTHFIRTNVRFS